MNIVHTLLLRWADRALRFENARLAFGLGVAHMEIKRLKRYQNDLIDRAFRQDDTIAAWEQRLAERDAEIAALKCALDNRIEARRDDIEQDAAINRRNEEREDYYADLDHDRKGEWI